MIDYNGTSIKNVYYNGTQINEIYFNNTSIWKRLTKTVKIFPSKSDMRISDDKIYFTSEIPKAHTNVDLVEFKFYMSKWYINQQTGETSEVVSYESETTIDYRPEEYGGKRYTVEFDGVEDGETYKEFVFNILSTSTLSDPYYNRNNFYLSAGYYDPTTYTRYSLNQSSYWNSVESSVELSEVITGKRYIKAEYKVVNTQTVSSSVFIEDYEVTTNPKFEVSYYIGSTKYTTSFGVSHTISAEIVDGKPTIRFYNSTVSIPSTAENLKLESISQTPKYTINLVHEYYN